MRASRLLATLVAVAAATATSACTPHTTPTGDVAAPVQGEVIAVVDGDTIDVELDGVSQRIRVLGIDAPEVGRDGDQSECYAEESRDVLNSLIYGQTVTLTADASQDDADRYGRLLRYVALALGDVDAGLALLEAGAAAEYTYDVAYERQEPYRAAETAAQGAAAGMWQPGCGA